MKKGLQVASKEFFLFLMPLFFVLHGYINNMQAMQFSEAIGLWLQTVLAISLILLIGLLNFRSLRKASVFAFSIMFFHLFFGPLHDLLKSLFPSIFLSKYIFILPVLLFSLIALMIYLKKTKRNFNRFSLYLNGLFLLLILLETPNWIIARKHQNQVASLPGSSICDTCEKPDIYLIIADEYADSSSLQQIFNFNNQDFQTSLRNRGFYFIKNSKSNYNFTPFAMASLLQMDYLTGIEGHNSSMADKNRCYQLINKSSLWHFLQQQGYEISNHSIFNIANIPTAAPQNYILIGKDMILSQTFLSRLDRDLRYHLVLSFKIESEIERIVYFINRCNNLLLGRLLQETAKVSAKPKFVYTHLTMPHYPYYFTKEGKLNKIEVLKEGEQVRKEEYIGYLQYSNSIFLKTIDTILQNSKKPPIILFMGDHGFREFTDGFEKNAPYYYQNQNAVLLPDKNYNQFYDGISSVNQFRVLLNTSFGQQIPLLKDSTILIYE
ncbi:MAG: hypothetical protein JWR72_3909 [Flavisolibacter sp.]|jgi:hypothetical protein|nr:hypothetical protein [Flavisolibacter sp.]